MKELPYDVIKQDFENYPNDNTTVRSKRLGYCAASIRRIAKKMGLIQIRAIKYGGIKKLFEEDFKKNPLSSDLERSKRIGCSHIQIATVRKSLGIKPSYPRNIGRQLVFEDLKKYPSSTIGQRCIRTNLSPYTIKKYVDEYINQNIIRKVERNRYEIISGIPVLK